MRTCWHVASCAKREGHSAEAGEAGASGGLTQSRSLRGVSVHAGELLWSGGLEPEAASNWKCNFISPIHSKCISYNLCYFEPGSFTPLVLRRLPLTFRKGNLKEATPLLTHGQELLTLPGKATFYIKGVICPLASRKLSLKKSKK